MRLHRDHVRLARRLDDAQRNCFGNRHHQHRALLMHDLRDRGGIFNGS
jgi:hypothetical protein